MRLEQRSSPQLPIFACGAAPLVGVSLRASQATISRDRLGCPAGPIACDGENDVRRHRFFNADRSGQTAIDQTLAGQSRQAASQHATDPSDRVVRSSNAPLLVSGVNPIVPDRSPQQHPPKRRDRRPANRPVFHKTPAAFAATCVGRPPLRLVALRTGYARGIRHQGQYSHSYWRQLRGQVTVIAGQNDDAIK